MYCASSGEAGQPYRLASYRTRIHQQPLTLVAGKTLTGRNLIGQSQRCLSRARKTEDYEALLLSNLEEHERLSRMINSMLFLARAEHGAHPPAMEPVSVTATIDKLLDYFSDMAKEQTVHLLNQTRENEDLTLLAAPDLLQRALANLLDNALRHCPANGTIAVSASSSATSIRLSVTNSGDAIAAEHLPRLFERFYRGDQARSHSSETGGLGLAIVQSIMALHDGQTSVENSAHGVCFSLNFPPH